MMLAKISPLCFALAGTLAAYAIRAQATESSTQEYLAVAEKNFRNAKVAVAPDQAALSELLHEEAALRRQALGESGSWVEPPALWRRRLVLEERLQSDKRTERRMKSRLDLARNQQRRQSENEWSASHPRPWLHRWWE
jgi:hypothetical protein